MRSFALALAIALAASAHADELGDSVKAAQPAYEAAMKDSEALLLDGKYEEMRALFQKAVPADNRTVGHNYVLGGALFQLDPENSLKAYEAAWKKLPDNPYIELEYAVGLHRARKYAEAEKIYAKIVNDPKVGVRAKGLRADCLLRAGQFADAAASWAAADPKETHSDLEEAASWIYNEPSPEIRRCRLLADLAKGGKATWEELILLDVKWDMDWWNVEVRDNYVKHDLELAAAKLKPDSARYKQLEILANTPSARDNGIFHDQKVDLKAAAAALKKDAEALNLLGDQSKLAENSHAAVRFLYLFRKCGLQTAQQQIDLYEKEMLARHNSKGGDLECADELAALCAEVKSPKLADLDPAGWKKYSDERFLASLLASKKETLKSADPLLVEGLKKFPDNSALAHMALDVARREGKGIKEALARSVQADYTHLFDHAAVTKGFAELAKAAGQ
jgi:Tfp pilus assembly protein PilF